MKAKQVSLSLSVSVGVCSSAKSVHSLACCFTTDEFVQFCYFLRCKYKEIRYSRDESVNEAAVQNIYYIVLVFLSYTSHHSSWFCTCSWLAWRDSGVCFFLNFHFIPEIILPRAHLARREKEEVMEKKKKKMLVRSSSSS